MGGSGDNQTIATISPTGLGSADPIWAALFSPRADPRHLRFQPFSGDGDLWQRAEIATRRALGRHAIASRCVAKRPATGLPQLAVHIATGPKQRPGSRSALRLRDVTGMGVSDDGRESRIKAIVEVVERYCLASAHDEETTLRSAYCEVAPWAIRAEAFALFSERQYGRLPGLRVPAADDEIDWTWAYSLSRRCFRLVPAALVFGSASRRPPNNFVESVMSTGMACHVSFEAAALAGLLEVVERDAVMLSWLHRRVPRRIEPHPDSPVGRLLADYFALPGFTFTLLDLTMDSGIPVVACMALGQDPAFPAAALGSAARLNWADASRKALFEATQILYVAHGFGWTAGETMGESEVRSVADHARFYAGRAGADRLHVLASSPERAALHDLPDLGAGDVGTVGDVGRDLQTCVERLGARGLEVLAVDMTTEELAACGFYAVRVLVPGALDICGDVRFPRLGSHRVRTAAAEMGWPVLREDELNLDPCPLA